MLSGFWECACLAVPRGCYSYRSGLPLRGTILGMLRHKQGIKRMLSKELRTNQMNQLKNDGEGLKIWRRISEHCYEADSTWYGASRNIKALRCYPSCKLTSWLTTVSKIQETPWVRHNGFYDSYAAGSLVLCYHQFLLTLKSRQSSASEHCEAAQETCCWKKPIF